MYFFSSTDGRTPANDNVLQLKMKEVIRILAERTKLHKRLKEAEGRGDHIVVNKLTARLFDFDEWDGQEAGSVDGGDLDGGGDERQVGKDGGASKAPGELQLVDEKDQEAEVSSAGSLEKVNKNIGKKSPALSPQDEVDRIVELLQNFKVLQNNRF